MFGCEENVCKKIVNYLDVVRFELVSVMNLMCVKIIW